MDKGKTMNKFNIIILFLIGLASLTIGSNVGNCTASMCNNHGTCDDTNTYCICESDYITFKSTDDTSCNYKQKNTLIAFLLEFFLGFAGIGYFYIGRISLGIGQLILNCAGLIPFCVACCCGTALLKDSNSCTTFVGFLIGCYLLLWCGGILTWWVYALVTIAHGNITDGNGAIIPQL